MNIPEGWLEIEGDKKLFKIKTSFGTLVYCFGDKILDAMFQDAIFLFLAKIDGVPATWDEIEEITGISQSRYENVEIELENGEIFQENEKAIAEATEYFSENVGHMLTEALENFFIELVTKALLNRSGKGHFSFKMTEIKVFEQILKIRNAAIRERIDPKKATAPPTYWTHQRCCRLVKLYDKILAITKEAKKAYKKSEWMTAEVRRKIITEQFPELPAAIYDEFELKGKSNTPEYLTLGYLRRFFGNRSADALSAVIKKTRREDKRERNGTETMRRIIIAEKGGIEN